MTRSAPRLSIRSLLALLSLFKQTALRTSDQIPFLVVVTTCFQMQYSHPDDVDALSTRLPPLTHQDSDRKLPSISTVAGLHTLRGDSLLDDPLRAPYPSQQWPPLNGPLAFRQQFPPPFPLSTSRADSPATMDLDGYNSTTSIPSPDRHSSTNSVNLDDPDVRLAAEALGDLRAGMCPKLAHLQTIK